ncbi:Autoinducer 2 sensor kinase/phosphatase LuxQ [Candidatus Thermoflexus japonica]|uniref:Circadian input-output histidine kinase CikA n=1 Tax=Candidatus Thermoflexus japonica TaxID=2035417 RepID=A0A2H5Y4C0_9CHLR|nr:Autoinducer 2 sensor kinase/phosphatase LuxQ [Candidatus Thermoflexus japonica]
MITLDWGSWPLRWKFLAGFVLIVLVSVVGTVEVAERLLESALQRRIVEEFQGVARTQRAALEQNLWHQIELLSIEAEEETLAFEALDHSARYADPTLRVYAIQQEELIWKTQPDSGLRRRVLRSPAAEALRAFRNRLSGHLHLLLTDAYGVVIAATEPTRAYRFDREPWWQGAWNHGQGAPYISTLQFDEDLQTSVVYLAVPVYRRDTHQAVGVLRSAYGASQILEILSQFRTGQTGRAMLIDRDGTVLMDPLGLLHREQRVTDLAPVLGAGARPEGSLLTPEWMIAYSRVGMGIFHQLPSLEERGWILAVLQAEDEALAPVKRLGRQALLWTLILGALAIGLSFLASSSLTRPLGQLTEAARRLGSGQLNVRVPVTSRDELGVLAETFNTMALRLQDLYQNLERRVQERTHQLQTAAEMGRLIASTLDLDELLRTAVNLIRDRLGYYHASVFLVDESGRWAVLRESTGEIGRKLKERGHRLEVGGRSLIGWVTAHGRPRVAQRTAEDPVHFKNELLPETRSEAAFPLKIGDRIIGALDVQSTLEEVFDAGALSVLQILADQLAVAIENARLYQQAQSALEETQALYLATRELTSAPSIEVAARALLAHLPSQGVDRYVLTLVEDPDARAEDRVLQVRLIWDRERGLFTDLRRYTATELPIIAREPTREPIFVLDVATDPWLDEVSRSFYLRHRVRSIAFFPLWAGESFWGWLIAQGVQRPLELEERTIRRLQALADTAAVVLQNRRLFELLEQRLREQALLYEVAASLEEASGLEEVLARICRAFTVGLGATSAYVNRESTDGQGFQVISEFYALEASPEERVPDIGVYYRYADYPLYARMRESRQPVVLRRSELEAQGTPEARLLAQYSGRTVLLIPLTVGDQYYGHVEVWDSRQERWFSGDEIRLAMALAGGAALALQRAELFSETERRARLLHAAAEVSRITATILDPNRLMAEAVELIRERFNYYYVGWFVPDEEGKWMVLAAGTGEPGRIMKERGHRLEIGGQSMVGWVAAHRRARIALDVGLEPVRFANPLLPLTRSEIALPMIVRGELVGVLDIQSEQPAAFTEEDIRALQVMADQLATAWQNARLYAQAQDQARELATLHRLAVEFSRSLNLVEILEAVCRAFVEVLGADHSGAALWEKGRGYGVVVAEYPHQGFLGVRIQIDNAFTRQAMETGQPQWAWDVLQDERLEATGPLLAGLGIRSIAVVPLVARGEVIATVGLDYLQTHHRFTAEELRLVQTIAQQAAVALENALLYEQAQRQARRIQTAAEISRIIVSVLDVEALLQQAVDLVRERFDYYYVGAFVLDPSGEWAVLRAGTGEAGRQMVTRGHRLRVGGESMIGQACARKQPVIAQDVSEAEARYINPLLPNTRAEMALPLVVGDQVLGALTIQADRPQAFSPEDLTVLGIVADNLAVALQNAMLYEEQKRTAERLRELDRLKTQFIANMSHELRTPLNSIIGFSRVILKGIDGPLTEAQRQDLTAIYNAGQHLLGLINDILDLSKIEAGRMELHFAEVDMREIVRGVMSTAVGLTRDKPIELRQEVPEDLPPVWADAQRARQILLNLVSNAAKFTDQGFIAVRAWADEAFVTIAVQDTGIGIPKEKQEEIFQEFTQVESGTTRRYGGTGLGLAIARRLVELMGGRIWVESEVGKGSTFFFTLPRARPAAPAEPRPGRPVVLCVDDDPGVITLYRRYLEKHGFEVVGLTDPHEILEVVRRVRPDVITLDIMMPQKDGWAVLQELKTDPETRRIPVIICSIVDERGRGFSLGAAEYLVKPFTEEELLEAIQRVDGRPGPLRVLVIDDSEADRQLIRRVLERMGGYQVLEASGGQEGTALARRERPDLVILDLMMPEMDGFMVVEALKEDPATRLIPIIVLTAKSLTDEDRQRLNGRIEALLQKVGVDPEALLAEIVEVLRRSRSP